MLTNAQLAQIAVEKPKSISELSKIEGIGQGKCEKFGEAFLRAIQDYEKKRQSISQDNRMESTTPMQSVGVVDLIVIPLPIHYHINQFPLFACGAA